MFIREINLAYTYFGADQHQAGPRQQPALRDWAEVVDLQFHGGEAACPAKMVVERAADCRVGKAGSHTAVYRSRAVEEFGPHAALDSEHVAMHANQFESNQVIERMPGQVGPSFSGRTLRVVQVW